MTGAGGGVGEVRVRFYMESQNGGEAGLTCPFLGAGIEKYREKRITDE